MFEKQPSPHVPEVIAPIEPDFSPDEPDLNVFKVQNQVFDTPLASGRLEGLWSTERPEILNRKVDFGSSSLVTAVRNLINVIEKSETHLFALLTEKDYQELVTILDDLIDTVGQNENHILASLMNFVGILIENYEDKHVPELTII